MKLATNQTPVYTSNVERSNAFSIAMNAKAFKVLSDNLYQNKIGSIVRELSCNALDAHKEGGKGDVPFDIHMPDAFEPWFSVKDYGLGLSHDSMENVFCKYFESTKDNSNDSIGAYGIGAKSFFAYTDTASIVSVWNGERTTYAAFIDDAGMPTLAVMAKSETDEPNGVEIQIAVKVNDIYRFNDEVRKQLHHFKVKPNISNNAGFAWTAVAPAIIETESFALRHGSYHYIVQGQVGYPLDIHQVLQALDDDNRKFLESISNGRSVTLYFDIGDIEVTASREGIQYGKMTLASIAERVNKCRQEINDHVMARINSLDNEWQQVAFVNTDDFVRSVAVSSGVKFTSAVPFIISGSGSRYYFDIQNLVTALKSFNVTDANGNVTQKMDRAPTARVQSYNRSIVSSGYSTSRSNSSNNSVYKVTPTNNKFCIVIRDTGVRPVVRINSFCQSKDIENCLSIIPNTLKTFGNIDTFIANLSAALGGFAEIYKVSEMPDVVTPRGPRVGGYTVPTCYEHRTNANICGVTGWERCYGPVDEMLDGGYYVKVDRRRVDESVTVLQRYEFLIRNGYLTDKLLYGIREKDINKIEDNPEWIPLSEVVDEVYTELLSDPRLDRAVLALNIYDAVKAEFNNDFEKLVKSHPAIFTRNHPFNRHFRMEKVARWANKRYNSLHDITEFHNVDNTAVVDAVSRNINRLKDRYPLAREAMNQYRRTVQYPSHVLTYIEAVDSSAAPFEYVPWTKKVA